MNQLYYKMDEIKVVSFHPCLNTNINETKKRIKPTSEEEFLFHEYFWKIKKSQQALEDKRLEKVAKSLLKSYEGSFNGSKSGKRYNFNNLKSKVKTYLLYLKLYEIKINTPEQVFSAARAIMKTYYEDPTK